VVTAFSFWAGSGHPALQVGWFDLV
jgi:hypothetical protein